MAPRRIHFGRIVAAAVAVCLALAAAGTTGGSSSPGGETGAQTAPKPGESKESRQSGAAKPGKNEKKHPPLELPTGEPEPGPTKAQQARVPTADIKLSIPGGLTAANTCNGKNLSPALAWRNVPPDTTELAVFATGVKPVDGKLHFEWAMAGIDPSITGLKAGEVPKGAILGRNGTGHDGYSLCPIGSAPETYVFSVYAITSSLSPHKGFDALELRKRATRASDQVGITAASFGG